MTKTKHPCAGITKVQRAAFERIAINEPPRAWGKTIDRLLERGLIQRGEDEVLGRDRFGMIVIPSYFVPIPVHMQWCQWASENFTEDDLL